MGLKKGQTNNRNGRPKGVPNKRTAIIKALCDYIADNNIAKFEQELNSLKGKDYVNAFFKISKHCF